MAANFLSMEQRGALARSAGQLLDMEPVCAAVSAEVEAIMVEHPLVFANREAARPVLWGLVFPLISQMALANERQRRNGQP